MASERSGTKIELTRGDTYIQKLNIRINGEHYVLQEGDEVSFAVKRNKVKSDRSDYIDDEPLTTQAILLQQHCNFTSYRFTITCNVASWLQVGSVPCHGYVRLFSPS